MIISVLVLISYSSIFGYVVLWLLVPEELNRVGIYIFFLFRLSVLIDYLLGIPLCFYLFIYLVGSAVRRLQLFFSSFHSFSNFFLVFFFSLFLCLFFIFFFSFQGYSVYVFFSFLRFFSLFSFYFLSLSLSFLLYSSFLPHVFSPSCLPSLSLFVFSHAFPFLSSYILPLQFIPSLLIFVFIPVLHAFNSHISRLGDKLEFGQGCPSGRFHIFARYRLDSAGGKLIPNGKAF